MPLMHVIEKRVCIVQTKDSCLDLIGAYSLYRSAAVWSVYIATSTVDPIKVPNGALKNYAEECIALRSTALRSTAKALQVYKYYSSGY